MLRRIEMDVDTDDHGEEGITLFGVNAHIIQAVIIKQETVYSGVDTVVIGR